MIASARASKEPPYFLNLITSFICICSRCLRLIVARIIGVTVITGRPGSRGHIRERRSGWAVVVELGRDPRDGRRRQKWVSGFATRFEAERALPRILRQLDETPVPARSSSKTLALFLREWLATLPGRGLRLTTIDGYCTSIEAQLIPRLGATALSRLTAAQLNSCYMEMLTSGRRDGRGGLSPRTVRLAHTIIRKALSDAVRWGQIDQNVADNADPPRAQRAGELRIWSAQEICVFLDSLEAHPLRPCFWLLATTGMRRGEALGLRWRDIDFEHARLSVVQTVVRTSEGALFSPPKTARGRRSIALDRRTLQILRDYRQQQLTVDPHGHEFELVFHRADGTPIPPHTLSKTFSAATKRAGLPAIRLHDVRHSYASLALQAGVHVKIVSERLGHASVMITLDVYSHVLPALDASAAEQIADLLTPQSSAPESPMLPQRTTTQRRTPGHDREPTRDGGSDAANITAKQVVPATPKPPLPEANPAAA